MNQQQQQQIQQQGGSGIMQNQQGNMSNQQNMPGMMIRPPNQQPQQQINQMQLPNMGPNVPKGNMVTNMNQQPMNPMTQNQMQQGPGMPVNQPQMNPMMSQSAMGGNPNMMTGNPNMMGVVRPGMPANQMINAMQQGPAGQNTMMNQMNPVQMNQNQMMNMQHMRKQEMMIPNQAGPAGPFAGQVRSVTPNFMRQSPSPMSVPSPIGLHQSGMVASPAMVPSPQAPMSNPPQQRHMPPNVMAPSPNMNTPGQPHSVSSPLNPQDDQIYREKYNRLTKYKEPLKKMISRVGSDGINSEKITKLKKLLEILSNPDTRIPLETLVKCEIVLENQFGTLKDPPASINNPLYDAIANNLQSPLAQHTLARSFNPSFEAWFGPNFKNLPPSKKRRLSDDQVVPSSTGNEIPHILQREIARLDQKFKISLDQIIQTSGSKSIKLMCCVDDSFLPCVPPISVTIPEDYPSTSPVCHIVEHEYSDTLFLAEVQKAFRARIAKLPQRFSLTHILETWCLAIRQACNPSSYVEPTTTSVLLAI